MINSKLLLASSLIFLNLALQADTETKVIFGEIPNTVHKDEYGNSYYDREATIKTTDFKVEKFWSKFTDPNDGTSVFDVVSKKGLFRVTTESTSACSLDTSLSSEGCSGQKPFLINDEVLAHPIAGTTDEYEVVFSKSTDWILNDDVRFYPLDISRNEDYYKEPSGGGTAGGNRGFFGFFTSAFDFIFSKTIGFGSNFFGEPNVADVQFNARSDDAEDRRQRYIANIIAGIDKEDRMKMGASPTNLHIPVLNTPASLLHYAKADKLSQTENCKFMFLNLDSKSVMCRAMSGFGMDAWMPFFNKSKITKLESSFIMNDTENSLLALTGEIEGVPYMQDVGGNEDHKLSFLQNMLKPMTSMMGMMRSMLFGSSKAAKVADPVERVYNFSEDNAMTLTFAVTNSGTQVDSFEIFKLLKIRSVYGDKVNSCRVKKKPGMISWSSWTETFYEGDSVSHHGKTGDEWVDWCQEATGKKGMFNYLLDWSSGGFFNPINWMKGFFSAFLTFLTGSYDILDFSNSVGRGLILNLKKTVLDTMSPLNTTTIQTMHIRNGQ